MAELEIHHEGHESDPLGQKIGILAAVLAVFLAIVTIASHRAHTAAVLLKAEENNQWSYYESKRIKFHSLELGEDILGTLAPRNEATDKKLKLYRSEKQRYERQGAEVQEKAEKKKHECEKIEERALFYDIGEGLLEIGLVLTSLYFISKKTLFPALGVVGGLSGIALAIWGLMV